MLVKYIVNKTKMAYQFQNGKVLERLGVLQADEKDLADYANDYFFQGLKNRGAILVSQNKPDNLNEAGATIARNDAEIEALKKENEELKKKLAEAQATGKETATVIDSNEVAPEVVVTTKKSRKKE